MGLNTVSKRTFHRHKNEYLLPAVKEVFTKAQDVIFSRIKEGISKVFPIIIITIERITDPREESCA